MRVGVVRETKVDEHRVALTPAAVDVLTTDGHEVIVESGAGAGSLIADDEYAAVGATIVATAPEVWGGVELLCKVKEPQEHEFELLADGTVLFTYLHLAAYPAVAEALVDAGVTGIAYETVEMPDHTTPLLAPMSEVAGRMAAQVGARLLEKREGGRGVLMGGVPGTRPANVVVIGAGMAGGNAATIAHGMGAAVTVFDLDPDALRRFDRDWHGTMQTRMSNPLELREAVLDADVVVGAVLLPGAKAPRLVDRATVAAMRPGSVLVDISIDQGGCFETSRETSHSDPTYIVDEVVHYAVGNIPGAVPRTSTYALGNATLPYLRDLAAHGVDEAVIRRPELGGGVNTRAGRVVHPVVADALGAPD